MSAVMTTAPGAGLRGPLSALRIATLASPGIVVPTRSSNQSGGRVRVGTVTAELQSCAALSRWDNSELRRLWKRRAFVTRSSVGVVDALAMEDHQDVEAGHGVGKLMVEVRAAYKSGRTRTPAWRVEQLNGIVRMLGECEGEILEALFADLGKPAHEAYVAEISLVRSSCKLAIKELKKWMTPVKVSGSVTSFPSSAAVVSEPLGVTLVISAWNFPFLLSVDPMIGAISAGCAMVLKPSEVAPATSALLAKLVPLYLDSSMIRVVEGGVEETTALLEQKWDKIFYTGSAKVGRIVMAAAAKHLTPVTLELGGKCPAYFDRSADLKVGLRRIAQGKWGNNNGQACISPDYILVDESIASELVDALKDIIEKFYGKDPKMSKDLARVVNASHYSRLTNLLDDPRVSSKIVHGGERDESNLYIAPTLVYDVPLETPLMLEEIFGPILPIMKVISWEILINS
ncbi:hypothetical protein KC19_11G071900 [Ceratodon purpureus]|uniref:Aldehyde dehydrogenase domain-containing protein n=1 Tax=Ceratodon purpureus TaxID=3225 RepID=A0A8T0GFU8_CERPU|nr:hypothetical protein KC19_11G071900 [Ceratodon purpureus]